MPDRVTATVHFDHLPPEIQAKLRERPIPGTRYRVTAEPAEESDGERLDSLRADLQAGRDDLRAGQGEPLDMQAIIAELHRESGN